MGSDFDNAAAPAADTPVRLTCRYSKVERPARCTSPEMSAPSNVALDEIERELEMHAGDDL